MWRRKLWSLGRSNHLKLSIWIDLFTLIGLLAGTMVSLLVTALVVTAAVAVVVSDDSDFPLGVGVLVGSGPDGVRPYRYGQEYKAEVGRGILMGLDADYTIKKRYFLGGIIINNDTYMGKIGIRF
jgi:hypothetical protein